VWTGLEFSKLGSEQSRRLWLDTPTHIPSKKWDDYAISKKVLLLWDTFKVPSWQLETHHKWRFLYSRENNLWMGHFPAAHIWLLQGRGTVYSIYHLAGTSKIPLVIKLTGLVIHILHDCSLLDDIACSNSWCLKRFQILDAGQIPVSAAFYDGWPGPLASPVGSRRVTRSTSFPQYAAAPYTTTTRMRWSSVTADSKDAPREHNNKRPFFTMGIPTKNHHIVTLMLTYDLSMHPE
jgi:hypothetical protein